jgi:hypothetical protein
MADQFSDDDLRELHRLVQQAALKAYPNPERKGCPGLKVLGEIASLPNPSLHPAYEHVKTCSPCLQEMLDLQEGLIKSRRRRRDKFAWAAAIAAAILICIGISIQMWRVHMPGVESTSEIASAAHVTVNLFHYGTFRGNEPNRLEAVTLPAALVKIEVILPQLSEPGKYGVSVTEDRAGKHPIAEATGRSMADGPRQIVTVILDLRAAKAGSYFLSTTLDQDESSYYYPVTIR